MSNEYGAIPLTIANDVGSKLKKKMGSLTGYAPVDWAETINKLGNKLPERTVSGAVCSFSDGADDVPMPSVKASITAVQAGSGDPSPSNVRAISGFAECDVYHTGTNLFDKDATGVVNGKYYNTSGAEASSTGWMISAPISLTEGVTYFGKDMMDAGTAAGCNIYNSSDTLVRTITLKPNTIISFTAQTGEAYIKLSVRKSLGEYKRATFTAGETIPVWMGGVNLWGGSVMLDSFKSAGISGLTYDDSTINYTAANISTIVIPTIQYKENTQYTFIITASNSKANVATNLNVYYTDSTSSSIKLPTASAGTKQTAVFVTASGKTVDRVQGFYSSGTNTLYYNESGLFEGVKTAQDFVPCRYIYGGELNLTTGVLTVTHESADIGNLEWSYVQANTPIFQTPLSSLGAKANSGDCLCSIYKGEASFWNSTNKDYRIGTGNNGLNISNSNYSTSSSFKTAMSGVMIVFPLATPTTIQLTPEEVRSFLGTNNLWANTGDSEVTYYAQPNIPTEVLHKGQISTTSDYATANFSETVADAEEILVKVYCPARSAVDYKVIKVADIGNGLNVGFNLHTTVNCTITKTSIASYQYSGDYYDIYADVLAYDSSLF